jgi:AbrB family looped-hinge helix DNA binding protein
MDTTSVTSKGQVTIPKPLRQQLGLRQGSKVEFVLVGDHVEMRVFSKPAEVPASGFGMLKSKQAAVPADFDPADLLVRGKTTGKMGRRK